MTPREVSKLYLQDTATCSFPPEKKCNYLHPQWDWMKSAQAAESRPDAYGKYHQKVIEAHIFTPCK